MDGCSDSKFLLCQTFRLRHINLLLSDPSYLADGAAQKRALYIAQGSGLKSRSCVKIHGGGGHHAE
jgi:hypothetical protein